MEFSAPGYVRSCSRGTWRVAETKAKCNNNRVPQVDCPNANTLHMKLFTIFNNMAVAEY